MADTKISAEAAATTLTGTEITIGVQTGANVKITMAQIVNLAKLQNLSAFAATTSAQLAGVISDETGTGLLVFATSPTLTTPVLGVATATSINKVAITAPATGSTLTIADGKTLTVSNTLTFTGTDGITVAFGGGLSIAAAKVLTVSNTMTFTATDGSTISFGAGGTLAYTSANLSVFAATTSAQLAGVISDETGTGLLVFGTAPTLNSPVLVTPTLGVAAGTSLALGGATIGTDALAVTGSTTYNGNLVVNGASFILQGNISAAAWTTNGLRIKGVTATLTDTTSSGTVATAYTDVLGGNTIAASSATVFTNYFSLYMKDPVAGTNVTLTNKWAFGADSAQIGTATPLKITTAGVIQSAVTTAQAVIFAVAGNANAGLYVQGTAIGFVSGGVRIAMMTTATGAGVVALSPASSVGWSNSSNDPNGTIDLAFGRIGAANSRQGLVPSATPIAQIHTLGEASRGGTDTNVAGASGTLQSGAGTGSAAGSSLIFQTPTTGTTGTTAQTYATRLTLTDVFAKVASGTQFWLGNAAVTGLTAGVLAATTNASIVIFDSTGQAYRVPCII